MTNDEGSPNDQGRNFVSTFEGVLTNSLQLWGRLSRPKLSAGIACVLAELHHRKSCHPNYLSIRLL